MPIPIPYRASGFKAGAESPDVNIDVFIDLQCPHSKKAWPTIIELRDHYLNSSVSITVHIMTLSNHRQAWDMSLGLFAVAKQDADRAFDFISFVYERQAQFYNAPFLDKTHAELQQLVADFAYEFNQGDREQFLNDMHSHDVYIEARTPIRFAATRAVWATPTLFINNADDVPVNHESNLADWQQVIDPLLKSD